MYKNDIYGRVEELQKNKLYVLDFKQGDVTGDGEVDDVFIVGSKPSGLDSPFSEDIQLVVQDGKSKKFTKLKLKANAGYNPQIFLGDFTGNGVSDILISIDSGGSGAIGYYYIYSFLRNKPKKLFDFEDFNKKYKYSVEYKNNYVVEVISKTLKEKYIIDIRNKDENYLREIYHKNGRLKKPISGFVNPISGLYPLDVQRDGVYGLYVLQKIAGRYNADSLGFVQTYLEWDKSKFEPTLQQVSIYGSEIKK